MTTDYTAELTMPPDEPIAAAPAARSWSRQLVIDSARPFGVRLALAWIGLVAFCAVFAPLLANSFPLLVKIGGKWSSPAVAHFTPADVVLLSLPVQLIALWLLGGRVTVGGKTLILLGVTGLVAAVAVPTVRPLKNVGPEEYRKLAAAGKVQSVLNAPIAFSPTDHLNDQFVLANPPPWPPGHRHLLGTEDNNEDILSVMIHACRIAMGIGFISTGIAVVIGVVVGSQMGYFAGVVDLIGMRAVEIFSAIPQLYLLIAFCAAFDRDIFLVMAIIGLTAWTGNARFVRAEFLRLRNQDFVHAAIAGGVPLRSVLFRHILPNALAPLLVSVGFGVASAILGEAVLSFLGLGLPVDAPSWGRLLNQAVAGGGGFFWWLAI